MINYDEMSDKEIYELIAALKALEVK